MFNSIALDVVIGLTFVFLLYSLFASILQEIIAKYLQLRALMLRKALRRLLQDSEFTDKRNLAMRLLAGKKTLKEKEDFVHHFLEYPTIKYLGEGSFFRRPAYIKPETYAEVLVRILRGANYTGLENQMQLIKDNLAADTGVPVKDNDNSNKHLKIDTETHTMFVQMMYESSNDIDKFKSKLVVSFNEMMERAEGWYKKQTRLLLSIIGFVLAASFNVDTIQITKVLIDNKQVRDNVVNTTVANFDKVKQLVGKDTSSPYTQDDLKNISGQITSLNNILGSKKMAEENLVNIHIFGWGITLPNYLSIIGWLITAFAISLGATFWFDLLQRLISIRQAGVKPEEKQAKNDGKSTASTIVENKKLRVG
ncbi:hypothetical protein QFZ48_004005 [Chitinophaga sp. W2I13]|uniref:hypothetical protein n=1 Tax=Chitinophaga sp. W2I13 TaxID=3373923 RepID=UPI003D237F87